MGFIDNYKTKSNWSSTYGMLNYTGMSSISARRRQKKVAKYGTDLTEAAKIQNNYNAEQAQIARDWEEEMYNKYESPSAMVAQYQDAGLNPALMYQGASGGSIGSSAVASGSANSPSNVGNTGLDIFNSMLSMVSTLKSMQQQQQDINVGKAQEEYLRQQAEGQRIDNDWSAREHEANVNYTTWKTVLTQHEIPNKDIDTAYKIAQTIGQGIDNKHRDRLLQLEGDNIELEMKLKQAKTDAEIDYIKSNIQKNKYEMDKLWADTQLALANKLVAEGKADIQEYERQGMHWDAENKKFDYVNRDFYKSIDALNVYLNASKNPMQTLSMILNGSVAGVENNMQDMFGEAGLQMPNLFKTK